MNIKNIALTCLTSIVFTSCGLADDPVPDTPWTWEYFDTDQYYGGDDYRIGYGMPPFPIIFHYGSGGLNSDYSPVKIHRALTMQDIPDAIWNSMQIALQGCDAANIQVYEAYCKLSKQDCNYFTHTWSMDKMDTNGNNRLTEVASGVYSPINIKPQKGQLGENGLIQQTMSFHKDEDNNWYLSGNCARFSIEDMNNVAEGWFVSLYDPMVNAESDNIENQIKKAIVVHWYFIPSEFFGNTSKEKLPKNCQQAIEYWSRGNLFVPTTMEPQFYIKQQL